MREALFGFIEKSAALAVELETELTKRPAVSPESGGSGELDKCVFLEGWLRAKGITHLERFDAPDGRAKGGVRPNLVATIPGRDDSGSRFWVMSHLDVVPPGDLALWKSDPWTVVTQGEGAQAQVVGRGVEDNQQGLVSSVLAALALVENGLVPPRTVKLLFAADEENGSAYGILWLLKNAGSLFRQDDMVLIPDGGDRQGETIEIAEKNLIWLTFTTAGKQAHGASRYEGGNAHLAGADLAVALHYGLSKTFDADDALFGYGSTFQPTKQEANVPNINTIPGEDIFSMDMRVLPRYPVTAVLAEVDRIKASIEAKHQVSITYTIVQSAESKATPSGAPLVTQLAQAIKTVYGVATRPVGIGGGTVAAPLRNEGIAAAVWARINEAAHQPNEYALIANILGDAKVMALLMAAA